MLKLIALTALVSSLSTTEGSAQEWFSKPKQSLPPTAAQQYCSEVSKAGLVRYCGAAARVQDCVDDNLQGWMNSCLGWIAKRSPG
jgi:hypothetical protein